MSEYYIIIAACLSFAVTALSGVVFIPLLRRLRFGQSIREDGPTWHEKKQGTPTMGGIMFILGIGAAVPFALYKAGSTGEKYGIIFSCLTALLFGFVGFIDDFIKVSKKQNLGVTVKQKLFLQFAAAIAFTVSMGMSGLLSSWIDIPFTKFGFDIGFAIYPLTVIAIVGIVNAVNITDGLDGLASGVTWVVGIFFLLVSSLLKLSGYSVISAALAAAMLGFLVWNFYPAKVFMGDVGSLFLGGLIGSLCFALRMPLIFLFVGIVYMIDILSDVIQVLHYKRTKRRVFLMAPIHHHFEKKGWSEVRIVITSIVLTIIFSAAVFLWIYFAKIYVVK